MSIIKKIIEISYSIDGFSVIFEEFSNNVYYIQVDNEYPNPDGIREDFVFIDCSFEESTFEKLCEWIYNNIKDIYTSSPDYGYLKFCQLISDCKGHIELTTPVDIMWQKLQPKQYIRPLTLGDMDIFKQLKIQINYSPA